MKVGWIKKYSEYADFWIEYKDCDNSIKTLEDFFKSEYIAKSIKSILSDDFIYDNSKSAIDNIKKAANSDKTKMQSFKKTLVQNFTINDISESYQKLLQIIEDKIKG